MNQVITRLRILVSDIVKGHLWSGTCVLNLIEEESTFGIYVCR